MTAFGCTVNKVIFKYFIDLKAAVINLSKGHAANHQSYSCTCTYTPSQYPAPKNSSQVLLTDTPSWQHHCQSTPSRLATEPSNTRHRSCITIINVLTFNSVHPCIVQLTLDYIIQLIQPQSSCNTQNELSQHNSLPDCHSFSIITTQLPTLNQPSVPLLAAAITEPLE